MVQETGTMSHGLNAVMLIGYLGRSLEMRYTPNGKPVASFSIVTTYPITTSDGTEHEETEWFNVIAWGSLAEMCKDNLHAGQRVFIQGRMKTRRWIDEQNGSCSCAEVVAYRLIPFQQDEAGETTDVVGQAPVESNRFKSS
jgi:single-strand DNA-binding protein